MKPVCVMLSAARGGSVGDRSGEELVAVLPISPELECRRRRMLIIIIILSVFGRLYMQSRVANNSMPQLSVVLVKD
jgi:hypothetical protein